MQVAGFSDGMESSVPVRLAEDLVRVVSIPTLLVLKFFAWLDRKQEKRDAPTYTRCSKRHERRVRDILDIAIPVWRCGTTFLGDRLKYFPPQLIQYATARWPI
jgi:hypothetical protein